MPVSSAILVASIGASSSHILLDFNFPYLHPLSTDAPVVFDAIGGLFKTVNESSLSPKEQETFSNGCLFVSGSLAKFGVGSFGDHAHLGSCRVVVRGKDTAAVAGLLFLLKGLPGLLLLGVLKFLLAFPMLTLEGFQGPSFSFLVRFGIVFVGNQMRRDHKIFNLFEFLLFFGSWL